MRFFLRAIQFEWKTQCSQRSNWLLVLAFMTIFWMSFKLQELPIKSAFGFSTMTAEGLGLFGSLFIIVISVRNMLRETHRGFDHFWSRSLPARSYSWLKYIGSALAVFTFLLPTLLCFLALLLFYFGFGAILPGLKVFLVLVCPTFLFVLSLSLLISLLIQHNVLATLILALVVAGILVQNFDVTRLLAFAPYAIFTSATIGFGPDRSFVLLNRVLYLSLALLNCVATSILANYRLPVITDTKNLWLAAVRAVLAISLTIFSGWVSLSYQHLSKVANLPANPSAHIAQKGVCDLLDSYKVQLVLDETGNINSGTAILKLRPVQSQQSIPITLNTGLKMVENPYITDNILIFRPENDLRQEIKIQYQGQMIIPRFAYSVLYQEHDVAALGFESGFYADADYVFILGGGTWHPFS